MTKRNSIIFFSVLTLWSVSISSCKNESKSKSITQQIVASKTFENKYLITIAQEVEAKAEPTAKASVVKTIPMNTVLKHMGEKSDFKDTVTINGRRYIDPYTRVQEVGSNDQYWVISPAMRPIYSGSQSIKDASSLQQFANYISTLNSDQLESGGLLLDKISQLKSDDIASNDAMFFMGYDFLQSLVRNAPVDEMIRDYSWTLDDYADITKRNMDYSYHALGKQMQANGIKFDGELGNVIALADPIAIDKALDSKVSKSVKEYLDLLKLSYKSKILDGTNINVPLTSVVNQANLWTSFVYQYPDFAHVASARVNGDEFSDLLLNGTRSTPAFDHKTRVAKDEFKVIWEYVLNHYRDTPLGDMVYSHTQWLEANEWKFPEEKHVH